MIMLYARFWRWFWAAVDKNNRFYHCALRSNRLASNYFTVPVCREMQRINRQMLRLKDI